MAVMREVSGLTKVNYNACDYASGLPVIPALDNSDSGGFRDAERV